MMNAISKEKPLRIIINYVLPITGIITGVTGWMKSTNFLDPTYGYQGGFVLLIILSLVYLIPGKKRVIQSIGYGMITLLALWYSLSFAWGEGMLCVTQCPPLTQRI